MDGATKTKRMFPAYTTSQLEARVVEITTTQIGSDACMMVIALQDEIDRRKSGQSTVFVVPQL